MNIKGRTTQICGEIRNSYMTKWKTATYKVLAYRYKRKRQEYLTCPAGRPKLFDGYCGLWRTFSHHNLNIPPSLREGVFPPFLSLAYQPSVLLCTIHRLARLNPKRTTIFFWQLAYVTSNICHVSTNQDRIGFPQNE